MNYAKVSDTLSVAPQISVDDVVEIAALGYKTIICNRPDNEDFAQPEFETIEAAAKENGIEIIFQPIIGGILNAAKAAEFGELLEKAAKPVFAYCRTGTRCITLWSLSQRDKGEDIAQIVNTAANLGYDVRGALANL